MALKHPFDAVMEAVKLRLAGVAPLVVANSEDDVDRLESPPRYVVYEGEVAPSGRKGPPGGGTSQWLQEDAYKFAVEIWAKTKPGIFAMRAAFISALRKTLGDSRHYTIGKTTRDFEAAVELGRVYLMEGEVYLLLPDVIVPEVLATPGDGELNQPEDYVEFAEYGTATPTKFVFNTTAAVTGDRKLTAGEG